MTGTVALEIRLPDGGVLAVETVAPMPPALWLHEVRRRLDDVRVFVEAWAERQGQDPCAPDRSACYTVLHGGNAGPWRADHLRSPVHSR